jgi:hypothetical protein
MEQLLRNIGKYTLWILDEFTYFLPDVFLVLAVLSLTQHNPIMTVLLFITYLGVSYGEYQYFKNKVIKQSMGKVMTSIHNVQEAMKKDEQQFISLDGLLSFADMIEEVVDEKIDNLKQEIKGVAVNEMDSTPSEKEVQ